MRRLPLGALVYFEAAARHRKFTSAAEELHVSQGAVSQQIKSLEDRLGCPLFVRNAREMRLTKAGARLLPAVQSAMAELEEAIAGVTRRDRRNTLRVGALPTFSTRWLIPRLQSFHSLNADVSVELLSLPSDFVRDGFAPDLDGPGADVAVTYGGGGWVGLNDLKLFDETMVVVASPGFLARRPVRRVEDLAERTLLQHSTRPNAWRGWARQFGPRSLAPGDGPRFEHFFMVREAAIAGLGVALLPSYLVAPDIADGRLARPLPHALDTGRGYYLVWPGARAEDRVIRRFVSWLGAEAASDRAVGASTPHAATDQA